MNPAISGQIIPKTDLVYYHGDLKRTDSIYETVIVGYQSVIIFEYEDGFTSYEMVLFATERQAKKHLSTMYTTLLN